MAGLCGLGGVASIRRRTSSSWGVGMAKLQSHLLSDIPEPILMEMGRVVALWAHVEALLDSWTLQMVVKRHVFAIDDPDLKAYLGKPFARRLDDDVKPAVAAMALSPAARAFYERTIASLGGLRNRRDMIAHGRVHPILIEGKGTDPAAVLLLYKSYMTLKEFTVERLTLSHLQKISERMRGLHFDLLRLSLDPQCKFLGGQRP